MRGPSFPLHLVYFIYLSRPGGWEDPPFLSICCTLFTCLDLEDEGTASTFSSSPGELTSYPLHLLYFIYLSRPGGWEDSLYLLLLPWGADLLSSTTGDQFPGFGPGSLPSRGAGISSCAGQPKVRGHTYSNWYFFNNKKYGRINIVSNWKVKEGCYNS